ncbi:MAG: restriction endonuclease subunit S [Clostridia bacterium]|nr:restriction endonuclease subunit S [Clostridia bacterium]
MKEEIKKRINEIRLGQVPNGYVSTDCGVVPSDWKLEELHEIAEPITETAGNKVYETVSISAGIGFVNQAEKFGKELSGKQYEKYTVLRRGDFSYNKGNSNRYPQGCIYRLKDREQAAVPNVFESFRITKGFSDYYDHLFISGLLNQQLARKINHGVRDDGLLNLTGKDFYSCMVPVPSLYEQKKIAEILSSCDETIALYRHKAEQLKLLKKILLEKMFPQKGENTPEIRFSGFTAPWRHFELSNITLKIGSGKTPSGGEMAYFKTGIPLIRSQNIHDNKVDLSGIAYIDDETDESMESTRVYNNDILLNITGASIGRSAVFKELAHANVNQHVCIIRLKKDFYADYLQICLASDFGQKQIDINQAGGGRQGLNFQQIGRMSFMFPVFEEQVKLGRFFESVDRLIDKNIQLFAETQRIKEALMQSLLKGIVRVNTRQ